MALISPLTNVFSVSVGIDLGTADSAFVGQSIHIGAQGTGIRNTGSNQSFTVAGTVFGLGHAVALGDNGTDDSGNLL
jgi:hypothetical protein